MLKLCGFAGSNYHNKVKLALLEKNIPFEEQLTWVGETDTDATPLGKVPYLQTEQGPLCESTILLEYIEQQYPTPALLPPNAYAAAKTRELMQYLDLHLELEARKLYPEAFFGGKVSDGTKAAVEKTLTKNIAAFAKLAKFSPFVGSDTFTLADCAAIVHLPLVSSATKIIYGRDFLADLPVKDYLKAMGERDSVQRVNADRKANTALFMERVKAK